MKLFIRQPWFIGTMGAVAWIILLIVVLLLYRQRRSKKKKSQKALTTRGDFLVLLFASLFCKFSSFALYSKIQFKISYRESEQFKIHCTDKICFALPSEKFVKALLGTVAKRCLASCDHFL